MNGLKATFRLIIMLVALVALGTLVIFVKESFKPAGPGGNATSTASVNGSADIPVTIKTIKEQSPDAFQVTVEYPQFPSLPDDFNAEIAAAVSSRLSDFRQEASDNYAARRATAPKGQEISASDFNFIARWEPAQVNGKYVSFIIRFDSYTGGANESQELQTFSYDVAAKKEMIVKDLFPSTSADYLQKLSSMSRTQLTASLKEAAGADFESAYLAEGTAPVPENFQNFTFTDYLLNIYFPKYSVAPGAFGEQKVVIPLKDIR